MGAKVISATREKDGFHVRVDLGVERPENDPLVREWVWGYPQQSDFPIHQSGGHQENGAHGCAVHLQHGNHLSEEDYLKNILEMLPGMIEQELAILDDISGSAKNDANIVTQLHEKEI